MGMGSAAWADCLPDPPVSGGSTTCVGTINSGLTVSVPNTTTVSTGAVLNAGAGNDAAFTATTDASIFYGVTQGLNVKGRIDGGASAAGVLVLSDPAPYYLFDMTTLNIVVDATGVIEGATAVKLQARSGTTDGMSVATLDNSGVIQSTSGPAIVATDGQRTGFYAITNRAGGVIGGVNAIVNNLTNAGTIDGGAASAYTTPSSSLVIAPTTLTNSGTMLSNGSAATVSLPVGYLTITNSGRIANLGSGYALDVAGNSQTITNQAGGVIESGGPVAIRLGNVSSFVNRGTINGSVVNAPAVNYFGYTTWDLLGGTINGDLLLSAANDTVIGGLDTATGRVLNIAGRIDGGGGQNLLVLDFAQDISLDGLLERVVLPDNFQSFQVRLSQNAVLTLNGEAPDGLTFQGLGTVKTTGVMSSIGPALKVAAGYENSGAITATFAAPVALAPLHYDGAQSAVAVGDGASFANTGSITSINGHGLSVANGSGLDGFTNSGQVTAYGTALRAYGPFLNSGQVRSTNFVGANVDQSMFSAPFTNTGSIEGATTGVLLSGGGIVNSGVIKATNGVGVTIGFSGNIENQAGGVISGTTFAVRSLYAGGAVISNAGTINGDIDFRKDPDSFSSGTLTYIDTGGKLNGNLLLGERDDTFVADLATLENGKFTSVTGLVDAGGGRDRLVLSIGQDATASLDPLATFEVVSIEMRDGASATLTASNPVTNTLSIVGEGKVDLTADIATSWDEAIDTYHDWFPYGGDGVLALSIVSRGAISYVQNNPWSPTTGHAVQLRPGVDFENAGSLSVTSAATSFGSAVVAIQGGDAVVNSGTITLNGATGVANSGQFTNSGTLQQSAGGRSSIGVENVLAIVNNGTISTGGYAVHLSGYNTPMAPNTISNSGLIQSTASDAIHQDYGSAIEIDNKADGKIISATGQAVVSFWNSDKVRNDGEIVGGVSLSGGDDTIENYGSITGAVNLADGNDTFVQWVGGKMNGAVDGGYGLDTLVIDSTGGGTISTSQFINFESFKQIGDGSLNYVGDFGQGPIALDGNSAAVKAGDTVTTWGGVAFSGGAGSEHLTVDGSISGGAALGDGVDTVVNHGSIGGSVQLGAGDDTYTEGWGSTVSGAISGGDGTDTYILELAGDRNGLHARSGFENLGVTGLGDLTLTLDQNWDSISLAGANIYLTSGAYSVGGLSGGAQDEAVRIDADIAQVDLGGGADNLQVEFTQLAGAYNGGAGNDAVHFTATTPVTIAGSLSGFETIVLDGGQMAVSGALGAAGETTSFHGDSGQTLSILSGGVLSGTVDLGAGDDVFALTAGGQLAGTVLGGAGSDRVAIDLTADLSLRGEQLQQFETLKVTGTGALNFTGGAAEFDHLVTDSKDLTLAAGSSLNAGNLDLGGAANTMTVGGAFTGVVDMGGGDDVLRLTTGGTFTGSAQGGAGSDSLELALGGTDAAPIALGATPFSGFETLSLQSGVVSVSGDYGFDTIEVRNGRLIGLAGSRLAASTITVAQGATFGSAGAVTGNINVAGTLSPGASPGTMTVTGDVALASGSTALFEFTPTVSDQLVVSGTVTIAQGATLKLAGAAALTPGRRVDLITAGGGIVGSFSTIDGAQGLNLHIAQSATRLQALGLFTTDTGFSSQVSGLIGTLNTALIEDKVSASLIAALPALVDPATSKSDPRALARVTPQAYASATQLALEDGLSIVDASRAQARFAPETPGLFGFGQAIASRRTLDGDAALGVAKGKINVEGGLAGVGYGVDSAWAGVFVGYLNGRQRIRDLDVRTQTDSFAIGVQGQVRIGGFELGAMAAHDGADVDTRRAAPGGTTATGDYKLKSWIADLNLTYRAPLNADWAVQPRLGASYVRATRDGFVERGGGAFALTVQDDKSSTWFVDGQVELLGGQAAGARLHPFASLGFRSTADGGETAASGALAGLATPIRVTGLDRSGTLATAGAGAGYDLAPGLTVSATYAGEFGDGGRQAVLVGLNWKF